MKYYIICTQPRTGSHLLRALLRQQRCGNPDELIQQLRTEHVKDLDSLYKKGILGDVFGMTVHQLHFLSGLKILREHTGMQKESDFTLLNTLFPNVKFIYLYRRDKVKQAISYVKAHRTGHYTFKGDTQFGAYSESEITKFMEYICRSEAKWLNFFDKYQIKHYDITYESLCSDPIESVRGILNSLGVESPLGKINERLLPTRQYDEISEIWYKKYLTLPIE